jgi:ankyrin repeat protein
MKIYGNTPIHAAVLYNNEISIAILSRLKCNIDLENNKKETACMLAVNNDSPRCLKMLCLQGANIEIKDVEDNSPMKKSIILDHDVCTHILIEYGANIGLKYVFVEKEKEEDDYYYDEYGFIVNDKIDKNTKEYIKEQK